LVVKGAGQKIWNSGYYIRNPRRLWWEIPMQPKTFTRIFARKRSFTCAYQCFWRYYESALYCRLQYIVIFKKKDLCMLTHLL
jgi:hypothetical protein